MARRKESPAPVFAVADIKAQLRFFLLAFLIFLVVCTVTVSLDDQLQQSGDGGIVALELAGTSSEATRIINGWEDFQLPARQGNGIDLAIELQVWDWMFICTYFSLLVAGVWAMARMVGLSLAGRNRFLLYCPFVIALLDVLENLLIADLLSRPLTVNQWQVEMMTMAAAGKFFLLLVMLIVLAYLFGCWLMARAGHHRQGSDPGILKTLDEVIKAERVYLRFRREKAGIATEQPLAGLASSGGGIRSATVNLGVIERMLDVDLLRRMDYHSTVSGGGYLGAALASLLSFTRKDRPPPAEPDEGYDREQYRFDAGDQAHFDCAVADRRPFPLTGPGFDDQRPPFLSRWMVGNHFRCFGDFLIRRKRLFSRDVLRAIGAVITGMAASLGMFVLALMLCSSVVFMLLTLVDQGNEKYMLGFGLDWHTYYFDFALHNTKLAAIAGAVVMVMLLCIHRWVVTAVAQLLFARDGDIVEDSREYRGLWIMGTILALAAFIIPHCWYAKDIGPLTPAAFFAGATVVTAGCYLLFCLTDDAIRIWAVTEESSSLNRSLLSALFGLTLAYTGFALVIGSLPKLVGFLLHDFGRGGGIMAELGTTSVTGVLSAVAAALVAWVRRGKGWREMGQGQSSWRRAVEKNWRIVKNLILAVPVLVFVCIMLLLSSLAVAWLAANHPVFNHGFWAYCSTGLWLVVVLVIIGYTVDFNKLSLHYFYRDRLAEAYLATYGPVADQPEKLEIKRDNRRMQLVDLHGTCRLRRQQPAMTDGDYLSFRVYEPSDQSRRFSQLLSTVSQYGLFTPEMLNSFPLPQQIKQRLGLRDDVRVEYLTGAATSAPYHLFATCLNLTTERDMMLRTRKSDIFIFSKLYCGSKTTSFVPTRGYRRGKTRVGRAMTISGAAVDSSLGRNTFFAQSFATTLFNLRLGQWLENPAFRGGRMAHKQEDFVFWPAYLLLEALGISDTRRRLIHLSDGGHTGDNLGLVPLIDRRCRLLIAIDAEADPEYAFGSLLTALRYLQMEDRARITLELEPIRPRKDTGLCFAPFVLGDIEYLDAEKNVVASGCLLVLKSAVTPEMSVGLRRHKERFPEFPQETTADQFFSEDQFEAYRQLGREMASIVFTALPSLAAGNVDCGRLQAEYRDWLHKHHSGSGHGE